MTAASPNTAQFLDRTIYLGLLGLIVLTAIPYGSVQPWWEAIFECLVFGLAALWIVESVLSGSWRITGFRLMLPLIGLIVLLFLQTISWESGSLADDVQRGWHAISADPYETRRAAIKLTAYTATLALLLRYVYSVRRLHLLVLVVIGVGTASALFGIARQVMQHDSAGFILIHLQPNTGYGQFINANHFALLMEMALPLSLTLILSGRYRREQTLVWLTLALILAAAIVLANTRGGILAMVCEIAFLGALVGIIRSRRRHSDEPRNFGRRQMINPIVIRLALITGLMAIFITGVFFIGGEPLSRRLDERTLASELSLGGSGAAPGVRRIDIWRATVELIKTAPIVGSGFGGYSAAITPHFEYSGKMRLMQAHNDYLELAAGGGLLGVGFVIWFVIAVVFVARKNLTAIGRFRRAVCLGALAGMVAVAIHSAYDFGLHTPANALVLIGLIAMASASIRVDEKSIDANVASI